MWWELAWAATVLVATLLTVGGVVGWGLGLRGLWLYATAPVIAVPLVGGAAIIAPLAGVSWSILPVLALAGITGAVVWLVARRYGAVMPVSGAAAPRIAVALVIPAVIIAWQILGAIGSPENFSNTFDNVFHLNVVRFILDTGNASSLWVGHLTDHSGTAAFYPAAWHDVVSLVAQLSGTDSRVAVNAMTLVISAVIWPAGTVLLTRQLFGLNRAVLLSSGVLAAAFPTFPLLMMDYGVLYPYQLGVALVPATLAVTLRAVKVGSRHPSMPTWQSWLLLLGIIPGVLLAHPGAFVAWMAFTVPIATLLCVRALNRARGWATRVGVVGALLAYLVVGFVLLMVLRPSSGRDWPIELRVRGAVAEVLTGAVWYEVPAIAGVFLVICGVAWALVRRRPVATVTVAMLAVAVVLYIVVTALPYPHLRDALTGSWYNNRPRLAALLPLLAVPLGAYGAGATWVWIRSRQWTRDRARKAPRLVRRAVPVALLAAVCVTTQLPTISPVPAAVERAAESYRTSPSARLITSDELALIDRLDENVPADAVIVGSPWTGTALAYALADRRVVLPHMFTTTSAAEDEVLSTLNVATPGSATCAALLQTGVDYVLDFGTQEIHGASHVYPGLTSLDVSPALELVDQQGQAKLYRVVGC